MRDLKKSLLKSPLNCCLQEIPNDNLTKNENETNLLVKHKPKSSVQHLAKSFVKTDFSEDYIEAKYFENETNSITNNVYVYINSVVNETYALNCSVPKDVLNILLCYNEGIYPDKEGIKTTAPLDAPSTHFHELRRTNLQKAFRLSKLYSLRHLLLRDGDVESNPGPDPDRDENRCDLHDRKQGGRVTSTIRVTSYNVRGLKDENKLRHLLNHFNVNNGGKNADLVIGLQETYIEKPGKIPYLWRGNFFLTPGVGQSSGCVTLLSPHLNVVASRQIGNRAQVLACQKSGEDRPCFIVANLYAPNPNSREKMEFFDLLFDTTQEFEETYDCQNVIILGDFNLNFNPNETKNRLYTTQERRMANSVKEHLNLIDLKDAWENEAAFTWRRANSECFSTIDRIAYSFKSLKLTTIRPNWALSYSDHAAVEAGFEWVGKPRVNRIKIPRLDPSLAKSNDTRIKLENGFREMIALMPNDWNPHLQLEYAKMSIRTIAEKVQAERKKKEKVEEESINEELEAAIEQLGKGCLRGGQLELLDYVETLRTRKSILIEEKGKRLAEKLGTKWYNEGEKSNRYFLRLLNRATPDDFESVRDSDGNIVTGKEGIENEIVTFYKTLYENFDESIIEQDDAEFFNNLPKISDQSAEDICRPITANELRTTLQSCSDSAPGPDGIPYSIIGLLWPTFGPILTEAWNFSLRLGKLPPSHKQSYLKLIPKAGKDLNVIGNWRPISLSNCDHKIITKTYSKRMCDHFEKIIEGRQTAYLKNRLINDNVRAMISTLRLAEAEDVSGLIVSLDAKKAFDSVSHAYIEKCLENFGCKSFIRIFRTLYSELETDIMINGNIVKGFKIKRGVKQGDALSCIIFIICMEPLLNNISRNPEIEPIMSTVLNRHLPKLYAYADDVNATIKDNPRSVQALFREYERLTKMSGLELNAGKTELMLIGRNPIERSYRINYMSKEYDVSSKLLIKINGILFQRNQNEMKMSNLTAVMERMENHFKNWSRRSLSTMGKILICKTFGISQLIYLCQTMKLCESDFKTVNAMIYKYIWNRHFLAAKAAERIKREIVNKPVKLCGLGMLDVSELDASLKIKAIGRLLVSSHPFISIIRERLDLRNFFNPQLNFEHDCLLKRAIELLTIDRNKLWGVDNLRTSKALIAVVRETSFKEVLSAQGKISLTTFALWQRGIRKVKDLRQQDLTQLLRFIKLEKQALIRVAVTTNINAPAMELDAAYCINGIFKHLSNCSSKEIREARAPKDPVLNFKIGLNLLRDESLSWGLRISKLTSTRHKNILLRIAHGDIYTKDKLLRYGMGNDNCCGRCNQIEDLRHKFIECPYTKLIWAEVKKLLKLDQLADPTKIALGARLDYDLAKLTLTAEILQRIHLLREDQNFLMRPKILINQTLQSCIAKERNREIKNSLRDLLE